MKFRVLKLDRNNKITFTKEELETLLDDVYEEGRNSWFYAGPTETDKTEHLADPLTDQVDWDSLFTQDEIDALKVD